MKTEKKIEEFTKQLIKEAGVESPSSNFVKNIMSSIAVEKSSIKKLTYTPIISKPVWVVMALFFSAICVFIVTGMVDASVFQKYLNFNIFSKIATLNLFENIRFSPTFTFSFVVFSILVWVQLVVIRNFVNKQNSY